MPEHHAVLAPSSAERWLSCPASIRMISLIPKPAQNVSPYATEGTVAHTVAELTARYLVLNELTKRMWWAKVKKATEKYSEEDRADMVRHAEEYAVLLSDRLAVHPHSKLLLEQQLPTGIDQCWGTTDAVIVSTEHVEVVDYKYGQGIAVSATDNAQLKLYGVGALEAYGDVLGVTKVVRLTIFQPRIGDGHASYWEIDADELRSWRDYAGEVGARALGPDAEFGPSEKACRFCPAAGECRARMEAATAEDFGTDPDLIDPYEIGELLKRIPEIKQWCAAVEATALRKAYSDGVPIPGWKVVRSGGRRSIKDQRGALSALHTAGFKTEQVGEVKLKGIGELEKLLGKNTFNTVLGTFAVKGEGSPSLALEDDKREAISPNTEAVKDFNNEEDS